MTWPYPGDSPAVKARRVAWAYRQKLAQADPAACKLLDHVMTKLGQRWAVPRPLTARPDEWVPAADAAEIAAISMATLRGLRATGRLRGRQKSARRWEYRVADILALSAETRTRNGTP